MKLITISCLRIKIGKDEANSPHFTKEYVSTNIQNVDNSIAITRPHNLKLKNLY